MIDDNIVLQNILKMLIAETSNEKLISVYVRIFESLNKPYSELTPQQIWRDEGMVSELFFLDMADYYLIYFDVFYDGKNKEEILELFKGDFKQGSRSRYGQHSRELRELIEKIEELMK
jgi:hypothetical protein